MAFNCLDGDDKMRCFRIQFTVRLYHFSYKEFYSIIQISEWLWFSWKSQIGKPVLYENKQLQKFFWRPSIVSVFYRKRLSRSLKQYHTWDTSCPRISFPLPFPGEWGFLNSDFGFTGTARLIWHLCQLVHDLWHILGLILLSIVIGPRRLWKLFQALAFSGWSDLELNTSFQIFYDFSIFQ